jgi:hypothetical protein
VGKLRELIARTPTRFDLAEKQALEHAFEGGRGGVDLELTREQYRKRNDKHVVAVKVDAPLGLVGIKDAQNEG